MINKSRLKLLQAMQKELDKEIYKSKNIKEVDIDIKMISLDVEFSEMYNCIESFKYWKVNKGKGRKETLKEASDVFHFILSIANDKRVCLDLLEAFDGDDLNQLYFCFKEEIFSTNRTDIQELFEIFLEVCYLVDIDFNMLYEAYIEKNKINYERIKSNY